MTIPRYPRSAGCALNFVAAVGLVAAWVALVYRQAWPEIVPGWLVAIFVLLIGGPAFGAWYHFRKWRVARTCITHSGIDLTDWLGRETHIARESIKAVWEPVGYEWPYIAVEVVGDDGQPCTIKIAEHYYRRSERLELARDELVRVLSFTEVEAPKTLWLRPKKRVWRRV